MSRRILPKFWWLCVMYVVETYFSALIMVTNFVSLNKWLIYKWKYEEKNEWILIIENQKLGLYFTRWNLSKLAYIKSAIKISSAIFDFESGVSVCKKVFFIHGCLDGFFNGVILVHYDVLQVMEKYVTEIKVPYSK